ncbi:FixH family protein [Geomicrobium sediminis]|uniref:YtkA-like domain-containing protein n=1 Tax=Geomicrobium sediminis TaxID=1347788 RepID=A0ABS2P7C3_9BACL|nr:FixH family protein [Geomicrobium sediminis]MBM7630970.1 hypothetical protein [Geomicrobium sediminis]
MSKRWIGLAIAGILLIGCESENEQGDDLSLSLEPVEVNIDLPSEASVGEELFIDTIVTQENEPVDDAHEVEVELRIEGQNDGVLIPTEHDDGGVYSMTHTFQEEGTYEVQSHVTARGMHVMPTKTIEVTSP